MLSTGTVRGRTIELGMALPFRDGQLVDLSIEPVESDPPRGSPAAILQAMREPPHLSREDVDELRRVIKESRLPSNPRGVFDDAG
jgi:hypothetical protein